MAEYTDGTNGNSPVKPVQNAKKLKSMVSELKIDMEPKFQHKVMTVHLPSNNSQVRDPHAAARKPTHHYNKLVDYSLASTAVEIWNEASGQGHPNQTPPEPETAIGSATSPRLQA